MRLTVHARVELSAIMLLLLTSCNRSDGPLTEKERDEVADIALDSAVDAIADSNIEERISEIENRLGI